MIVRRTLEAVAHDIGHHAQCGLSFLFPHLGRACRTAGILTVVVDLCAQDPYPPELPRVPALESALQSLSIKVTQILGSYGYEVSALESARLEFTFPPDPRDDSIYGVTTRLSVGGKSCAVRHLAIGTFLVPKPTE
jgi:hypothetical protein